MFTKSFIGEGWHVTPTIDPSEVSWHNNEQIYLKLSMQPACMTVLHNSQLCL